MLMLFYKGPVLLRSDLRYKKAACFYVALVIQSLAVWINLLVSVQGSQRKHMERKTPAPATHNLWHGVFKQR